MVLETRSITNLTFFLKENYKPIFAYKIKDNIYQINAIIVHSLYLTVKQFVKFYFDTCMFVKMELGKLALIYIASKCIIHLKNSMF